MINQDEFTELLAKYREGQCTEQEKALLESWITFGAFDGPVYDDEKLKEKIQRISVRLPIKERRRSNYTNLQRTIYIAASLAAILLAVWFFHINKNEAIQDRIKKEDVLAYIEPGKDHAYITLANGQIINLEAATNGVLFDKTGVKINKLSSGEIVYEVNNDQNANLNAMNTIETPRGGQYRIILPDGTKVWMNAASSLKFSTGLSKLKERRIELRGEAFFVVAKDHNRPFIVESRGQEVEVLGTIFNVSAYQEEPSIKTTLIEGSVKVTHQGIVKKLQPNQQAIVTEHIDIKPVTGNVELAWKNGDFDLENDDFHSLMRKISRWYNVDIEYDPSAPNELKLGGKISRNKSITSILNIMEATGEVSFEIKGRRILVKR
ncbi:FecR family protein [Sphingobacterium yanglingense]|uniref:FecR family protein n=1 Tax=Sphingobacterium yanglingense TaxID=1437280 RepID=A0A4R6WE87_9SPHI|nr:FecR family protein [Sphingobacterium yanglingense]TDQ78102.1 FecR family protein [Sphingobacterium yanglingense]